MSASNRSSPQRFPDLYALLNLNPLESDAAVVAAALRRLEDQLPPQHSPAQNELSAVRMAKLIELGKQHLLNPERKARYDQQWRQHHSQLKPSTREHAIAGSIAKSTFPPTEDSHLLGLFPSGDPAAAFRREEFVATLDTQHQSDIDAEYEQLRRALRFANAEAERGGGRGATVNEQKTSANVEAVRDRPQARALPARRLRKQREKKVLWLAIGGLTGIAALLALVYRGSFWGNSPEAQSPLPSAALQSATASRDRTTQPSEPAPRRSGLPAVEGILPDQDLTSQLDALVPVAPAESDPQNSDESPENSMPSPALPLAQDMKPPLAQDMKAPTVQDITTPSAAVNADPPQIKETDRAAWASAMHQVKDLIGQQQYAVAQQQLDAANELVKTPLQQSQLIRLRQICTLADEFQQALRRAIDGLTAGEVITIGNSTQVAVVDATEESISIRMRGENRKFSLAELPIGLAFALSDLSLDTSAPSTMARKAAFAWLHAGAAGNDVAEQRAREMLAMAVAEGAADKDLLQVFSDDYQLPELIPQTE